MSKGLQGVRDRKGHDEWSFRMEVKLKMIGKMDNAIDHTHDSLNRIYDRNGLCPTIPACSGGDVQPKIIEDFYVNRVPRVYRSNKGIKVIEDAKTTRGSDGVSTIRVSYHKNRERNIRENIETAKGYEGGASRKGIHAESGNSRQGSAGGLWIFQTGILKRQKKLQAIPNYTNRLGTRYASVF